MGNITGARSLPWRSHEADAKRILVADDDAMVRGALMAVLDSEGYAVVQASNGQEVVTQVVHYSPHLVLLDLNIPQLNGGQVLDWPGEVVSRVPIIVITARPNQYKTAVSMGVDAFMEKPLNIPLLLRAIKHLVAETSERQVSRVTNRRFVTRLLSASAR